MSRKHIQLIGLTALAAALLVIGIAALLPLLLSSGYVENVISSSVDEETGCTIAYARVSAGVFPLPHIRIHAPELTCGDLSVRAGSLSVYPELRSLLSGTVEIRKITAAAPEADIALAWLRQSAEFQDTFDVAAASRFLRRVSKGFRILVGQGVIRIAGDDGRTVFRLSDIRFSLKRVSGRAIEIDAGSSSSAWKTLALYCRAVVPETPGSGPRAEMSLEGADIDIAALKTFFDTHLREPAEARRLFAILGAGSLPRFRLSIRTPDASGGLRIEDARITGRLQNGVLRFPDPEILFDAVSGDFDCIGGRLYCTNGFARCGGSLIHALTLEVCLTEDRGAGVYVEAGVTAAAEDVLVLIERFAADKGDGNITGGITRLEGSACGVVTIQDRLDADHARVRIETLALSGRHSRIPFDFAVDAGSLAYEKRSLTLAGLAGRIGSSSFSGVRAAVDFAGEPQVRVSSGSFELRPPELSAAVRKLAPAAGAPEDLAVDGRMCVDGISLSGPLLNPAAWRYSARAQMLQARITSAALPGWLYAAGVSLEAASDFLSLKAGSVSLLDGTCVFSARVDGPPSKPRRIEARFKGSAGPQACGRLFDFLHAPEEVRLQSPIAVREGRLAWTEDGTVSAEGALRIGNAVNAGVKVRWDDGLLHVEELLLSDNESAVRCTMRMDENLLEGSWAGTLRSAALDGLLLHNPFVRGWISGDIALRLPYKDYKRWRARGSLSARSVTIPGTGLAIGSADVDADNKTLSVKTLSLGLGETTAQLCGTLFASGEALAVDGDCLIEGGSLSDFQKAFEEGTLSGRAAKPAAGLPLTGEVRIAADGLETFGLTWQTLRGTAHFSPGALSVYVSDARLCGMRVAGAMELNDAQSTLSVRPALYGQPLAPFFDCLIREKNLVSGTADLDSRLELEPTAEDPLGTLSGSVSLQARDGRIYRYGMLAKLFGLLNVTGVFRGRLPDFGKGLSYETITGEASLQEGVLKLDTLVIDSRSMKMVWDGSVDLAERTWDITVLAAPLRTFDFVLGRIPLLRRITGANVVTLPVKVSGPLDNPDVRPLMPSVVGSALIGKMKDVMMLPFSLLQPAPQESSENRK